MLRPDIKAGLCKYLEQLPYLRAGDFEVNVKDDGTEHIVFFGYLGDSGSSFLRATIPKQQTKERVLQHHLTRTFGLEPDVSSGYEINCTFVPGSIAVEEMQTVWGLSALQNLIIAWRKRIVDDLKNAPALRAHAEHEKRLQEVEEELKKIPDQYATAEQIATLTELLATTEAAMRARIEALEESDKQKAAKLEALETEFELLRSRISTIKLRPLLAMLWFRACEVASDPKTGHLIDNVGKIINLLGPGPGA